MTEESDELLSRLEPEARKALIEWMDANDLVLKYAGWEAKGNTSARLLGAYVREEDEEPSQGIVIKILAPRDEMPPEPSRHRRALRDSKKFAKAHLLGIAYPPHPFSTNGWITFQKVGGGGFAELTTLGNLIRKDRAGIDRLAAKFAAITQSVLSEWAALGDPVSMPVHEFLRELLANRLGENGTLTAWASRHPGLLEEPRPWLAYGDDTLVNPFALAQDPDVFGGVTIEKFVGKVHGDFHPDNILVPEARDADPDTYYLVDLSRYRRDGNVGWDPAYLATTLTALVTPIVQPSFDSTERRDLTSLLIDPANHYREERLSGIHDCLEAMHAAAMTLTGERGLKTAWRRQMPLCLLASSLVLSGRRILSARDREFFFWVAAHAATCFVRSEGLGRSEDPEDPLRLDGPLIDSSLPNAPASGPLVGSAGDERRRHQYEDDAKILQFPRRSTTGGDVGAAAAEDSTLSPGPGRIWFMSCDRWSSIRPIGGTLPRAQSSCGTSWHVSGRRILRPRMRYPDTSRS